MPPEPVWIVLAVLIIAAMITDRFSPQLILAAFIVACIGAALLVPYARIPPGTW